MSVVEGGVTVVEGGGAEGGGGVSLLKWHC